MEFNREWFVYTFNGNESMSLNTSYNLANERSDLHEFLIE